MKNTYEKSSREKRYQRSDKTELLGDLQPRGIFPRSAACSSLVLSSNLFRFMILIPAAYLLAKMFLFF